VVGFTLPLRLTPPPRLIMLNIARVGRSITCPLPPSSPLRAKRSSPRSPVEAAATLSARYIGGQHLAPGRRSRHGVRSPSPRSVCRSRRRLVSALLAPPRDAHTTSLGCAREPLGARRGFIFSSVTRGSSSIKIVADGTGGEMSSSSSRASGGAISRPRLFFLRASSFFHVTAAFVFQRDSVSPACGCDLDHLAPTSRAPRERVGRPRGATVEHGARRWSAPCACGRSSRFFGCASL